MGWMVGAGIMLGMLAVAAALHWSQPAVLDIEAAEQAVRQRVDQGLTPGMVLGVVDESGTHFFAYGHTRADGAAVDEDTVFEIGSITKGFVGLLLADMAAAGVVNLDDPVLSHLPAGTKAPRDGEAITLAQLASHTSGLPRLWPNFRPADASNPYAGFDEARLLEAFGRTRLRTAPGEQYLYSNFGAGLLGTALAHAGGAGLEALLRDRILEPLGLDDTAMTLNDSMRERLATGHAGGEPAANWDFDALAGAGALRSTARDMARFLAFVLGQTDNPLHAALEASAAPHADTNISRTRVGLGWHITRSAGGRTVVWHNGGTGGYRAFIGFDAESGRGAVVLSNSSAEVTDDLGMHLVNPAAPMTDLKPRTAITLEHEELEAFTGQFELAPGAVFDIELRGDGLHARLTGQDWLPIFPESDTAFFYTAVDAQLVFERGTDGNVMGLVLHQAGMKQRAARVEE